MKTPIKNVSLAFPCEKKWRDLRGEGKKKFCDNCNHTVMDFTNATADELQNELARCTRVCGRFRSSQLHPAFLKTAAVTSFIAASLASCDPEIKPAFEEEIAIEEEYEILGDIQIMGYIVDEPDSIALNDESDELNQ